MGVAAPGRRRPAAWTALAAGLRARPALRFYLRYLVAPLAVFGVGFAIPSLGGLAALRWWALLDLVVTCGQVVQRSTRMGVRETGRTRALEEGQLLSATLAAVVERLGLRLQPRIVVVEMSAAVRAATLARSDPVIMVSRRFIESKPPDDILRATFAHELGHLTAANRAAQWTAGVLRFWAPVFLLVMLLIVDEPLAGLGLWVVARGGSVLLSLAISRRYELQCDRMAIRAGCGRALLRGIPGESPAETAGQTTRPPEWLSTHPSTSRRLAQIEALSGPPPLPSTDAGGPAART